MVHTTRADLMGVNVKCSYCGKGLRNFKVKSDWSSRKLHKACWKIERSIREVKDMIARDNQRREESDKRWELYRAQANYQAQYIVDLKDEVKELKIHSKQLENSKDFYRSFATGMY